MNDPVAFGVFLSLLMISFGIMMYLILQGAKPDTLEFYYKVQLKRLEKQRKKQ